LGLKVLITEFDMTAPDEALQADFTRDFLTVCFSRPAVAGVLTWGFWEGSHWMPDAAFFKRDWTVTPMGSKWIDLTQNVWTIDQDVTTDANGQLNLRGYIGDDTMTVDGTKKRFRVKSDGSAEWLE
jgi:GH35 family endo-1,4-beta-xylanase